MNKIVVILGIVILLIGGALLVILSRPPVDGGTARTEVETEPTSSTNQTVAVELGQIPPQFQASWAPDRLS